MQAVRLYSGDDGESHFEEIDLEFEPDRQMEVTAMEAAKGVAVRRAPPGVLLDWHPAPGGSTCSRCRGPGTSNAAAGKCAGSGPGTSCWPTT